MDVRGWFSQSIPRTGYAWILAGLFGLGFSAFEGASEHLPALGVRGLVVLACWIALRSPAQRSIPYVELVAPIFALAVVSVGLVSAPSPGFALQPFISCGLVIVFFLSLRIGSSSFGDRILNLAVGVGIAHAVWAVGQVWLLGHRGRGGFFNPNHLAAFLLPLVVICLHRLRQASPTTPFLGIRSSPHWSTAALTLMAGVLATGSRTGGLVLFLILGGWGLRSGVPHFFGRPRAGIGIAVVAGLLLGGGLTGLMATRWIGQNDEYAYERINIWKRSAEVAWIHPFGVGLGHYRHAMRQAGVPLSGPVRFPKTAQHAHNEPLHAWVELGWLGLAASLLPAGMLAAITQRRRRSHASDTDSDWLYHGLMALSFAVPALLSASLHSPPVAFLAAAWAAGLLRGPQTSVSRSPPPSPSWPVGPSRRRILRGTAVGLVLLAVPGALSVGALRRAASLRDQSRLDEALSMARWSQQLAPWSVGAGMMVQSLRYLRGESPFEIGNQLIALAGEAPWDPAPLDRAAWLLEQEAKKPGQPRTAWRGVAQIRRLAVLRDPYRVTGWIQWASDAKRAGDPEAVEEALKQALEVEPRCGRALALSAQQAHDRGDVDAARLLAERAWGAHRAAGQADTYRNRVLSLDSDSQKILRGLGYSGTSLPGEAPLP